ncbi:MAG: substrate-binding domain-containing protein [Candidatus Njordarchaeales archaeon]
MGNDTYENKLSKITPKISLSLEFKGKTILDKKTADALLVIQKSGSLLAASKVTGIPYSRLWDRINKVERILGTEIVERRRGGQRGGGTSLTSLGKALLKLYLEYIETFNIPSDFKIVSNRAGLPDFIFMGSHDPILEQLILQYKKQSRYSFDICWTGSSLGLLSLSLGDSDIAGSHILDPQTGKYNLHILSKYELSEACRVIRGFQREIGIIYHPAYDIHSLKDAVIKNLRMVNRNPGSGTRILIDLLLKELADKTKTSFDLLRTKIKGYGFEVKTHYDVAKAIATRKADFGFSIKYIAQKYDLNFIPIRWEWYDFIILKKSWEKQSVQEFLSFIFDKNNLKLINKISGYRTTEECGKIVYE